MKNHKLLVSARNWVCVLKSGGPRRAFALWQVAFHLREIRRRRLAGTRAAARALVSL
jgi:hypothetical protein